MQLPYDVVLKRTTAVPVAAIDETQLTASFDGKARLSSEEAESESNVFRTIPAAPIVLNIATALSIAAAIGVAKMIELLTEDLYTSAKRLISSIFKDKPELTREIRIEIREPAPPVIAVVSSNESAVIEKSLTEQVSELQSLIHQLLVERKLPDTFTFLGSGSTDDLVLSKGAGIPDNIQWVLIKFDVEHHKWQIESILCGGQLLFPMRKSGE